MTFYCVNNHRFLIIALLSLSILTIHNNVAADSKNGFDLSNSSIPINDILAGGPPKDGIPALSDPNFISAAEAVYLKPADRVMGITLDGESRAYTINILNWHEIVNDKINDKHFAITYCPLCGTGVAFDSVISGLVTDFGVSGLLYNSDVLLYDKHSESLWSQIISEAISGKLLGQKLKRLPVSNTSWQDWREKHPDTLVLSRNTGFSRDYDRNPYAGYEKSRSLYFAVNNQAPDTYHPKEMVMGIEIDGVFKAYPFIEFEKHGKTKFSDSVNGKELNIAWDKIHQSVKFTDNNHREVIGIQGFWFAWFAFHPDTLVFKGGN